MKLLGRLKETIKDQRGNIEILMLLCCLVAVIAFINFALGIITLGVETEQEARHDTKIDEQKVNEQRKTEELKKLKEKARELEREIAEKKKELENLRELAKTMAGNEKVEQRNKLNDQLIELEKQIQQKEKELEETRLSIERLRQAKEKEGEIKKLQNELENLKKEIEVKKKEFEKLNIPVDDTIEKDLEKLKKEIEEAEKRKKELEDKLKESKDVFNPRERLGLGTGAVNINNPLYVECKQECIKLFPYNETINVSEIEKINPFSSLRDKHDGIVLLVRPDGLKISLCGRNQVKNLL